MLQRHHVALAHDQVTAPGRTTLTSVLAADIIMSNVQMGGPRVILILVLISTKCGGIGSNLTSANRVVKCVAIPFPLNRNLSDHNHNHHSMDLSWNFVAESQACDHVYHLGQEKDVFMKRLVVRIWSGNACCGCRTSRPVHIYPTFCILGFLFIDKLMDWCASCRIG